MGQKERRAHIKAQNDLARAAAAHAAGQAAKQASVPKALRPPTPVRPRQVEFPRAPTPEELEASAGAVFEWLKKGTESPLRMLIVFLIAPRLLQLASFSFTATFSIQFM